MALTYYHFLVQIVFDFKGIYPVVKFSFPYLSYSGFFFIVGKNNNIARRNIFRVLLFGNKGGSVFQKRKRIGFHQVYSAGKNFRGAVAAENNRSNQQKRRRQKQNCIDSYKYRRKDFRISFYFYSPRS